MSASATKAAVLQTATIVGAARAVLDMTNQYAKDREQFGGPIGRYQAVQYLVSDILIDLHRTDLLARQAAFRIDAAKHMEPWGLNYFDRAVYRSNPRRHLDGSTRQVFSFSEVFDGSNSYLQTFTRKDINPNDPGRIARSITRHRREAAYDQVIVGYLLQIATELRDANGAETAALRRRTEPADRWTLPAYDRYAAEVGPKDIKQYVKK